MGYDEMKLCQEIKNQFNITIYEFVENWKQILNNCETQVQTRQKQPNS